MQVLREEQLVIAEWQKYKERAARAFELLKEDPVRLELFLANPTGLFSQLVAPELGRPIGEIAAANRILFSLLSNAGFRAWAREYQRAFELEASRRFPDFTLEDALRALIAVTSRESVYQDFADAAVNFVDRELLASLLAVRSDGRVAKECEQGASGKRGSESFIPGVVPLVLLLIAAIYIVLPVSGLEHDGFLMAPEEFTRANLGEVARAIFEGLQNRGEELRDAGELRIVAQRAGGTT